MNPRADMSVSLRELLSALEFSQAELSRRIGVTVVTVNLWCNDHTRVPQVVLMYLRLLIEVRRLGK
jgi:transcriptional regulator with XRE-family HTH domain